MLVSEEPLGGQLIFSPELGHGGVEIPGVCRQVVQRPVEVAQPQVSGGRVAGTDGLAQCVQVFADIPEEGPLERARLFGGTEHPQDALVRDMPGRRQLPELPATVEVLQTRHPTGVLGPADSAPVLELLQGGR